MLEIDSAELGDGWAPSPEESLSRSASPLPTDRQSSGRVKVELGKLNKGSLDEA